ncbi:MAG: HD domain-containing protein [Paracoccus denitrificans]|uniref:HD domain-containing protein n=1 Tax=Paracoccus denitrificans TaxID=266 RepID=A0A533I2D1_PARDE|nr:MAG: HD domain-containing protein [Paracoccus denitrificans]
MTEGALDAQFSFLIEADKLKSVERANTLNDVSRQENSAEHSWHLALYAMVLEGQAEPGVDISRVIRMLILHDLVEIDVGDVPLHSGNGQAHDAPAIRAAEAKAARRIFGLLPATQGAEFLALWEEFEAAESPDAVFAKSLDRTQPLAQNLASDGVNWRKFDVSYQNIVDRVGAKVMRGLPDVWAYLQPKVRVLFGNREPHGDHSTIDENG